MFLLLQTFESDVRAGQRQRQILTLFHTLICKQHIIYVCIIHI